MIKPSLTIAPNSDSANLLERFKDAQKEYKKYEKVFGPNGSIPLYHYREMQDIAVWFAQSFLIKLFFSFDFFCM